MKNYFPVFYFPVFETLKKGDFKIYKFLLRGLVRRLDYLIRSFVTLNRKSNSPFMKKILVLLAVVAMSATTRSVNSNQTKSCVKYNSSTKVSIGSVPEAVEASFNDVVDQVMDNWYPGNSGYDMSGIGWQRNKGSWEATGAVRLPGSTQGIDIVGSEFKNTGEFVSLNYNVAQ